MGKIFEKYCKSQGINDIATVKFMYDGQRITAAHNPKMLEFEDDEDNIIQAFLEATGGSGW